MSLRAQGQAPNVTYSGPLTITQGGTYTGNFKSTNSRVPCILIQTTQPVIIENCILAGAGDLILANAGGYNLTVRNNRGYGLQQSLDNERHGRFLEVNGARSVTIENNYFEHTTGIAIYQWSGDGSASQTLKVRRNVAKNMDGRYRNGGGTFCNFLGLNQVKALSNVEVAWNQVINEPNNSLVEDNINFYNSGGTASSPMSIHDNYVQGAYPFPATDTKFTGTGMIVDGDGSSQQGYLDATQNQFVSTCNSAMNIAGGHHVRYTQNRMVTSGLLPNGTKLNATYCGIAVFNFYQQALFGNHLVDNNTMGMVKWGANNPFPNRNDNGDYGFPIHTNTQHLPNPITLQTEQDEWTRWINKLKANGITIGTGTNTNGGGSGTPTNAAPTVSLTSPATSSVPVGTVLNLTATAADADGSVAKVEFFNGATKLGEDTSAPYQLSYTAATVGTLTLSARATDNAGATANSGTATVTVTSSTVIITPPTAGAFYRAININGPAITLDGNAWQASNGASGVQIIGTPFANQGVTLNPATDATRASMIRSSVYGTTTGAAITVPNGAYQVYFYVWEDNNAETFNLLVEGQTVRSGYNSGSTGKWEKVGPFTANVTDGTLNMSTSGGTANLSGVEIWAGSATAPTNAAPTVSLTSPATSSVPVGTVLNLTATAADADGSVAKVEFFNGATKLGEDTSAPYQLSYTAATVGTLTLSARATDNAGAAASSASATVTVTTATTPTAASFYRAININGPAITLDGNAWQASNGASGVQIIGTPFANQGVTLNPATDATRASMIRSSVYGNTTGVNISSVPNGTYQVYLYVWEDNNAETFNILVEGQTVRSGYNSGSAGKWEKVGPFTTNVTDGTLNVSTSGGHANLSGVEVWKAATGTATTTQARTSVGSSTAMVGSVSAYPSPMTNELSIELNQAQTETMRVAILNQSGAVVQNSEVAFKQGLSTDKLNVSNLPAGNYFLRFTSGSLTGKSIQISK
ncbi:Ig-like domain-containing protein [Hymenobacter cellulosivorans]|uniref:Ig-like domain-containing protein n=1 Tax=Hymenobacter cellulosivorans TaxID=2932249 RepID=A0ABY4F3R3_9BACT|nr:Ig-like domain-containing protein [Hymenobacter cellulosivorans]UOQ50802.1 Ig-like domain-containing protein [Hymenobacter cellulosivorans]